MFSVSLGRSCNICCSSGTSDVIWRVQWRGWGQGQTTAPESGEKQNFLVLSTCMKLATFPFCSVLADSDIQPYLFQYMAKQMQRGIYCFNRLHLLWRLLGYPHTNWWNFLFITTVWCAKRSRQSWCYCQVQGCSLLVFHTNCITRATAHKIISLKQNRLKITPL